MAASWHLLGGGFFALKKIFINLHMGRCYSWNNTASCVPFLEGKREYPKGDEKPKQRKTKMSNEKKEPITDETVVVELRGPSGNAFCVMGAVVKALRRNGHREMIADYRRKATSGDYENLLKVSGEYVNIVRV